MHIIFDPLNHITENIGISQKYNNSPNWIDLDREAPREEGQHQLHYWVHLQRKLQSQLVFAHVSTEHLLFESVVAVRSHGLPETTRMKSWNLYLCVYISQPVWICLRLSLKGPIVTQISVSNNLSFYEFSSLWTVFGQLMSLVDASTYVEKWQWLNNKFRSMRTAVGREADLRCVLVQIPISKVLILTTFLRVCAALWTLAR